MFTLKYRYILFGLIAYLGSLLYLHFGFQIPFDDFLPAFLIIGVGLTSVVLLLTKSVAEPANRSPFKGEIWIVIGLIAWIVFYITYGGNLIDQIIPANWLKNERTYSFVVLIRKLLVFVAIPFIAYSFFGFSWKDFILTGSRIKFFSRTGLALFFATSIVIILFQYYFSNAGKTAGHSDTSTNQMILGVPLAFAWLFIEAGLVEEFFFRALLQSRLSALVKSSIGGIVLSSIIFGLSHAPGLYLRSAESEGISEQYPFLFFCAYTIVYMSIAGVFLAVTWNKTRNIWLMMAIHAVVDLLPFLQRFFHTWGIN
jgi:membrane protease YdiL (CAAX protease family)